MKKTIALTCLTMIAFAANSLLTRAALGAHAIDAASFTTLRLAAGAALLWLIVRFARRGAAPTRVDWLVSVPPLAVLGGVLFLSEQATWRLGLSSVAILGGIALVLWQRLLPRDP